MPFLSSVSWLRDQTLDRVRRVFLAVLRAGPIPQHVAFVMDGNRRYARVKGMKVIQGHVDGFVALRRVRRITCPPLWKLQKRRLSLSQLGSGNMFWPRYKIRFCICLCHRQLQTPKRRGRWIDALGRECAPGSLYAWVRKFPALFHNHGRTFRGY
jgi:undecaprenyl pyrophosphate synthase